MNNNILTLEIPKDLRDDIQRADLECTSIYNILNYITLNDINISKERINKYQQEYQKKVQIFEEKKKQLENDYLFSKMSNNKIIHWELNYVTSIVTMQIVEEI